MHTQVSAGRWSTTNFAFQMANIGSEVIRAVNWRRKGNAAYSVQAFYRALELFDLTLATDMSLPKRREVARLRSCLVDDFAGDNVFRSTDRAWERYFVAFTYLASMKRQTASR